MALHITTCADFSRDGSDERAVFFEPIAVEVL
jgi:hypothetical protein